MAARPDLTSRLAMSLLLATLLSGPTARAATGNAAIEAVLSKYEAALNAASTDQVLPLYAEDGVFMQPYGPSVVGKPAIRQAYEKDFDAFRLHVKFRIVEIVEMSPQWAFVRTSSSGTSTMNATHAQSAEANQELFIFRKTDAGWKIARYAFSTTNPPTRRPSSLH